MTLKYIIHSLHIHSTMDIFLNAKHYNKNTNTKNN